MASIFGIGDELNDYAALDILTKINDVLNGMTYAEMEANAEMVAELRQEFNEVERWHDAYTACWRNGDDTNSAENILAWM